MDKNLLIMKLKEWSLTDLFKQFIRDSYSGKRMRKDGKKIKPQTIANYETVLNLLLEFEEFKATPIVITSITSRNKRMLLSERKYWNRFFKEFTDFLFTKKHCHDNYVGLVIKIVRIFFNYLSSEKFLAVGDFYKKFYVYKEEVPIITLFPDQLKFLINNKEFEEGLTDALKRTKDIFVLGSTVGLRFSDLFSITFNNIERVGNSSYLCVKSIKTETVTRIKLPEYALDIIEKFSYKKEKRKTILPPISKNQFNKNLKVLAEKAGWTHFVDKKRSRRGKEMDVPKRSGTSSLRFCDLISSHVMRRTAVSTMLMLGMPEHAVKKISGHAENSKAFYRYVNLVQSYLDTYIDKVYEQLV